MCFLFLNTLSTPTFNKYVHGSMSRSFDIKNLVNTIHGLFLFVHGSFDHADPGQICVVLHQIEVPSFSLWQPIMSQTVFPSSVQGPS